MTKTLDGDPVRNADGSWNVSYLLTVTDASAAPSTGLVYALHDQLSYPAGVTVSAVTVEDVGTGGVTPALNPAFNGGLTTVDGQTVAADSNLFVATDRVPAASGNTAGEHQYRVTVTAHSTESALGVDDVTCGPDGSRGYQNGVELWSTDTLIGTGSACADIAVPKLRFTKTADKTGVVHPGDTITYTIAAKNVGDADFVAGDPAVVQDDMSGVLDDATYGADAAASSGDTVYAAPKLYWSGAIAAGKTVTITYTVRAGKAGVGDNSLVNVVSLPDDPASTIPACDASPDNNAPCAVTNPLVALPVADGASGGLADTGLEVTVPAALALLALLAGLGAVIVTRRRRGTAE